MSKNYSYLLNPIFIGSLFVLITNDVVLKSLLHNWFTGKASDFSGIASLFLFCCVFFDLHKLKVVFLITFAFIFWKSSLSQSTIDLWNSLEIIRFQRTVDYTDLIALLVLIPLYHYVPKENYSTNASLIKKISVYGLIAIGSWSFIATSSPDTFDGNVFYLDEKIILPLEKKDLSKLLDTKNIKHNFSKDTLENLYLHDVQLANDTVQEIHLKVINKTKKTHFKAYKLVVHSDGQIRPLSMERYREQKKYYEKLVRSFLKSLSE